MGSTSNFPPRQNPFHCFDLSKFSEKYDPEKGPYNLTFLSLLAIQEFKELIQQYGNMFQTTGATLGAQKLRERFTTDRTLGDEFAPVAKQIVEAEWYLTMARRLSIENFWGKLSNYETKSIEYERLQKEWFFHRHWAHLPSKQLVQARKLLQDITIYAKNAQAEINKIDDIRKIGLGLSDGPKITLPRIPGLQLPNPFHYSSPFIEECQKYITDLLEILKKENASLASAMQARLELSAKSEDLQSDDVLYDVVKKIERIASQKLEDFSIAPHLFLSRLTFPSGSQLDQLAKQQFRPMNPRKTLDDKSQNTFFTHITEHGHTETKKQLNALEGVQSPEGLPFLLVMENQQLILLPPKSNSSSSYFPPNLTPSELGRFNFAMHRIKTNLAISSPPTSSKEISDYLNRETVNNLLAELLVAFHFLQSALQKLPQLTTIPRGRPATMGEIWRKELTKKVDQVLEKVQVFIKFIQPQEKELLSHNPTPRFLEFLTKTQQFCSQVQSYCDPSSLVHKTVQLFQQIHQQVAAQFTRLLEGHLSSAEPLRSCLSVIGACNTTGQQEEVKTIQFFLFEDTSEITLSAVEKALLSSVFNISQEQLYAVTRHLILNRLGLRPFTPNFVRICREFDQKYRAGLLEKLREKEKPHLVYALEVIEKSDFEEAWSYDKSRHALGVLKSFTDIQPHLERSIAKFIERLTEAPVYLELERLDVVLNYGAEEQALRYFIVQLRHASEHNPLWLIEEEIQKIFQLAFAQYPALRQRLAPCLTPLVEKLSQSVSGQITLFLTTEGFIESSTETHTLSTINLISLLDLFSAEELKEKIDEIYFNFFRSMIDQKTEQVEKFLELLKAQFPSFPSSIRFKPIMKTVLEREIVGKEWSNGNHLLCESVNIDECQKLKKQYRLQWLRKLLERHAGYFLESAISAYSTYPEGQKGLQAFYDADQWEQVLGVLENFLQNPWYHPKTHALLRFYFNSSAVASEAPSPKFDQLTAQFREYDEFITHTEDALKALDEENFGSFKNLLGKLHVFLHHCNSSQSILSRYKEFLVLVERSLRTSLRNPETHHKSNLIIDALVHKYTNPEKEIFQRWVNENAPLKESVERVQEVRARLQEIHQSKDEIIQIYNWIDNIRQFNLTGKDWLLDFTPKRIIFCITTFNLKEKQDLKTALSYLSCEGYYLASKEALAAFLKILSVDNIDVEGELEFIFTAHEIVVIAEEFHRLNTPEARKAFKTQQKAKYTGQKEVCKLLEDAFSTNPAEKLKSRQEWKRTLRTLFLVSQFDTESFQQIYSYSLGKCKFNPATFDQIFHQNRTLKREKELNRHVVIPLCLPDSRPAGHTKILPDAPGIQQAASILRRLLHGKLFPQFELLRFPAGTAEQSQDYPVVVTEHVEGKTLEERWNNNEEVPLDLESFSLEYVDALFTRQQDGKPGNYVCVRVNNSYRLVPIENEAALGDTVVEKENKLELMHICALYCFDEMMQPMHETVRNSILNIDIPNFLNEFIADCSHYNQKLSQGMGGTPLFSVEECKYWDDKKIIIPIPLKIKWVEETLRILTRLQEMLQDPNITHLQILSEIYPEIMPFYSPVLKERISAKQRFEKAFGNKYLLIRNSYITLRNDTNVYLSLTTPSSRELMRPEDLSGQTARATVRSFESQLEVLKPIRDSLQRGELNPWLHLREQNLREQVLNGIDNRWPALKISKLPNNIQMAIFEALQTLGGFQALNFSDCTSLSLQILLRILDRNPRLRSLDLSRCAHFTQTDIISILSKLTNHCRVLEILKLSGMRINYIHFQGKANPKYSLSYPHPFNHSFIQSCLKTIDISRPIEAPVMLLTSSPGYLQRFTSGESLVFQSLRELYIDNCQALEGVNLIAPLLTRLHARGCLNLRYLRVLTFMEAKVTMDQENVGDFTQKDHLELSVFDTHNTKFSLIENDLLEIKFDNYAGPEVIKLFIDLSIRAFKVKNICLKESTNQFYSRWKTKELPSHFKTIIDKYTIRDCNFYTPEISYDSVSYHSPIRNDEPNSDWDGGGGYSYDGYDGGGDGGGSGGGGSGGDGGWGGSGW